MRAIGTRIDTGSAQYTTNREAYQELVHLLRERQQWAISGGPGRERSIERHLENGDPVAEVVPVEADVVEGFGIDHTGSFG